MASPSEKEAADLGSDAESQGIADPMAAPPEPLEGAAVVPALHIGGFGCQCEVCGAKCQRRNGMYFGSQFWGLHLGVLDTVLVLVLPLTKAYTDVS